MFATCMTKNGTRYSRPGFSRTFMVIIAVIGLLLSSCAVKYNVKSLFGLRHSSEQSQNAAKPGKALLNATSVGSCLFNISSDLTLAQQASQLDPENTFAAFAGFAFYFLFLGILLGGQTIRKPAFNNQNRFPASIPIFLQYRKLII